MHRLLSHFFHPARFIRRKLLPYKLQYIINVCHINNINLGCGYDTFPQDWLNIGLFNEKDINYAHIKIINNAYVVHMDVTKELPFEPESIQYIYASNFLEHIRFDQAINLLKKLRIILQKGGLIRLTVPDLSLWIQKYHENDKHFFRHFYNLIKPFPDLKTKGEILAGQLFGYNHQWAYDWDSLRDVLRRAGYRHITKRRYGDSPVFKLGTIEPSWEIRRIECLCVEGLKE